MAASITGGSLLIILGPFIQLKRPFVKPGSNRREEAGIRTQFIWRFSGISGAFRFLGDTNVTKCS